MSTNYTAPNAGAIQSNPSEGYQAPNAGAIQTIPDPTKVGSTYGELADEIIFQINVKPAIQQTVQAEPSINSTISAKPTIKANVESGN